LLLENDNLNVASTFAPAAERSIVEVTSIYGAQFCGANFVFTDVPAP
jgi:hypothetical protein